MDICVDMERRPNSPDSWKESDGEGPNTSVEIDSNDSMNTGDDSDIGISASSEDEDTLQPAFPRSTRGNLTDTDSDSCVENMEFQKRHGMVDDSESTSSSGSESEETQM